MKQHARSAITSFSGPPIYPRRKSKVYSPKIREDLIPRIYRAAKAAGVAMTTWVNQLIEERLPEPVEINESEIS
jgi:hypothetical protein